MSRRILLAGLLFSIVLIALLFRKIGLGEMAIVATILALAFGVESVRFVIWRFIKGYRN